MLGALVGAGVGATLAVRAGAQPLPAFAADHGGLVSILDFIPENLHAAILAQTDTTDLTQQVQAAFDSGARLWAPAEARFHVRQVIIRGLGRFFDLNNALFVGIATTPTTAVVALNCGHSEIRGLRVGANHSLQYRAAVHYSTSDSGSRPVGFNRFLGGQVDGARIGLLIGGEPEQRAFLTNRDPNGKPIDAPVSETTFIQWNVTGCICGLYMNQPNGKVQFIGCHLAGETGDWHLSDALRAEAAAVVIANPGSEIGIIGGSVEQLQEPRGKFVEVGGSLTISGATIETVCSSFLTGTGRLAMTGLLNGGFNSMTAPFIQAREDSTGSVQLSHFILNMPPANYVTGSNDLVSCVAAFNGRASAAPGLLVDLANLELREPRWSGGGEGLYPLVRGARVRMRQCRLTRYTSDNQRRLADIAIDDNADRLAGIVDRSGATLPAFGVRGGGTAGGWAIRSEGGGSWGRGQVGAGSALRLAAGSRPVAAQSPAFAIDPDRLFVLRAVCKFSGTGRVAFSVAWLDFTGTALTPASLFDGFPDKPLAYAGGQWLSFQATPPPGAERAMIVIEVHPGAELLIAQPSAS